MCPPGSSKTEMLREKMIYNYFPSKGGFYKWLKMILVKIYILSIGC